ncbi:SET and MYND domain-containing protein 4 [Agrilus planipennis]|uniref:SET and MYND domain-containing protein 4 n=1 Tax=Agrilus planipennis TaxID=224129 RepID=A0A1W4WN43_AGRPL|nr:SET and MYND domain-containing protein 4 [Agrilus planipennis]
MWNNIDEVMEQPGDIYEHHARLCQILLGSNNIKIICHDFNTLTSNYARVKFAKALLDKYKIKVENFAISTKDEKIALKFRERGNELFKVKKDNDAWEMYTKSISHSKEKSECLGLAFANRSAVLFQKGLYKECLNDISFALENNYPENILQKILLRKEKCDLFLKQQKSSQFYSELPPLEFRNEMIDCASERISINYSERYGRYVVAETDIVPGEVLAVEKPYAKILLQDFYYTHCHNCVKRNMNLIPCAHCNLALFCSLSCKENAWQSFHKRRFPNKITIINLLVTKKFTI